MPILVPNRVDTSSTIVRCSDIRVCVGGGASNTGSLQQRVLLLSCYSREHVTQNTAHAAPLTSAKEAAVNSS